jgi:predicted MPP superfamily phosphohydrolase
MKKKPLLKRILIRTSRAVSAAFIENHMLQRTDYRVASEKIPLAFDNFKILQLSDLHSVSFGRENVRLIRKIDAVKPDMIVMTGDMISRSDFHYDVFFRLAQTLGDKYICYYVVGNHELDMERRELKQFLARLASMKIRVLENERTAIINNGQSIDLYGMWLPLKYYREAEKKTGRTLPFTDRDIKRIMGGCDLTRFGILLAHSPLCFPVYARWGADLTLSGHVHGGMIRIPILGGLLSPERKFLPEYSSGIYEIKDKKLLVSRGLGSGLFGARILNRPEIVVITLEHR